MTPSTTSLSTSSLPTGTVTLVVEHSDSNGAVYSQIRVTLVP